MKVMLRGIHGYAQKATPPKVRVMYWDVSSPKDVLWVQILTMLTTLDEALYIFFRRYHSVYTADN